MPFGLHNAPATFQRAMDSLLGHDLESHTFVYLDDLTVATNTFEKHLEIFEEVLREKLFGDRGRGPRGFMGHRKTTTLSRGGRIYGYYGLPQLSVAS